MARPGAKTWFAQMLNARRHLLRCGTTRKQLRDLYVYALDGDEPDEDAEFTRAFFRGHKDPIATGLKWLNQWLREQP